MHLPFKIIWAYRIRGNAMKLTLKSDHILSVKRDLVDEATSLYAMSDEMQTLTSEILEAKEIVDNLELVSDTISKTHDARGAMEALGVVSQCCSLIGVAEDKISEKAALEGLGSKIWEGVVAFWEKIKAFFKKCVDFIKMLFSKDNKSSKQAVLDEIESTLNNAGKSGSTSTESVTDTPDNIFKNMSVTITNSGPLEKDKYETMLRRIPEVAEKSMWPILKKCEQMANDAAKMASNATKGFGSLTQHEDFEEFIKEKSQAIGELFEMFEAIPSSGTKTYSELGFNTQKDIFDALTSCRKYVGIDPMRFVVIDASSLMQKFGHLADLVINARGDVSKINSGSKDEATAKEFLRRIGAIAAGCMKTTRSIIFVCRMIHVFEHACFAGLKRMSKDYDKAAKQSHS